MVARRASSLLIAVALTALPGCSDTKQREMPPSPAPANPSAAPGRVVDRIEVGGQPCGVTDTVGAVWVSDAKKARLLRIAPGSGKVDVVARLDPSPCEITVAFGSLWVVTQSGRLDRVDPKTGHVTARIKVGAASYQAVATPGMLWVSNRNDGTLSQVDPRTDKVVRTVRLDGVQPGGMVYAGGSLWVGDDTTGDTEVLRIDTRTRHITKVTAGSRPAYLTATTGAIWVSNVSDGTVSRIDIATNRQTSTLEVGLSPVNLEAGHHGEDVWVPDDVGNRVVRIDVNTTRVVGRLPAPGGPAVVRAAFGDIWITMFGIGEVWRVHPY